MDNKHPYDELERDREGRLLKSEGNLLKALAWAGVVLRYDEFGGEYRIEGLEGYGPRLDDDAVDELYLLIAREYYLKLAIVDFRRIIKAAARRARFHPVRDYLASVSLRWDGVERLNTWLISYGGAKDTEFVRAVGRICLMAAVRRVRQPGCKFDEMVVLESPEGRNKSTAFLVLAGEAWFTDEAPLTEKPREVIEQLRGKWIVECADLDGMRRADVTTLKKFLSRRVDSSTLKYKEETTHFQRQCIFVGSTNEDNYLLSTTGNRRFWPVAIEQFDIVRLTRDRDQLWAEAALCEDADESIRLPRHLWAAAGQEQALRTPVDEWEHLVASWLESEAKDKRLPGIDDYRTTIAAVAAGALEIKADKLDQRVIDRVTRCMKKAGWHMAQRSNGKNWWKKV